MAEVFKAKTFGVRGFERLLVIKRILPHLSKDEEFVEMFIDEAKISVELTHANICQVTDLGKISDNYFIAMEYINGKDLRAILKKCHALKDPLTVPEALHICIELLKGLDYAHRKTDPTTGNALNLIHRDISPQNIMVSYYGDIKIVDFGIAKTEFKLNQTQAGVLKGKFGYMSPEQASGLELDARTDIFSAGIILHEMLSSRRLFLGESDFETLEKIKTCDIPPPSKYNPSVPKAVEDIVYKALAKEKEDRFQSAHEFLTALSKILYSTYEDFSTAKLATKLQDIFAKEIEDEQESLRRAVDALPAEELAAATSAAEAANDRLVESGSNRSSGAATNVPRQSSKNEKLTAFLNKFEFIKRSESWPPYVKPGLLFLIPALLVFMSVRIFFTPETEPKNDSETAQAIVLPVQILSEPKGAKLFIDGTLKGTTPATLNLRAKNYYGVRIENEGYVPFTKRILISKTQTTFGPYELEAETPKVGFVTISSKPSGAKIYIGAKDTNLVTPAKIEDFPVGEKQIVEVVLEGFHADTRSFTLESKEGELHFDLERKLANLTLNISPSNATVYLDGKERGHQILNLEAGRDYKLEIYAKGYEPFKDTYRVTEREGRLNISLKKKRAAMGVVNIGAIPWATVYVNGKKIGDTPIVPYSVSVGKHQFEFRHPDYKPIKKTITIKKGKNANISIDFRNQK